MTFYKLDSKYIFLNVELKGIRLYESNEGLFEGSVSRSELEAFLHSLSKNSPDRFYFKMFQFAEPRPNHTHGLRLKRESIALLQ